MLLRFIKSEMLFRLMYQRDPLDYSAYTKSSKIVDIETKFVRLKAAFVDNTITLQEYMEAMAFNLGDCHYLEIGNSFEEDSIDDINTDI